MSHFTAKQIIKRLLFACSSVITRENGNPSPEGLLGQLDDIGGGLDVDVVVVQGGWVGGGASLGQ